MNLFPHLPTRLALCLSLITWGLLALPIRADWPQFRGPGGMGVSPDKDVPLTWSQTSGLVWKIKPPHAGASSPIIVGGRIYLTGYSGFNVPGQRGGAMEELRLHLSCLNRADGSVIWDKSIEPRLPEQAPIRENHGYASSTPAADDERIYAFFGKSGVLAFTHDGKEVWRAYVGDKLNGWGTAASPVVVGDLLIINASVESNSLIALNKRTGKEVWRVPDIPEAWNTPILAQAGGREELVVAAMGKIVAVDPGTGTQLWSCNTDIRWYMVPSLVAEGDLIGCLGGREGIVGLAVRAGGKGDVTGTHRLWTSQKGSNVTSPVVYQGRLYWMQDNLGIAYCADLKSGKLLYEERVPGAGSGVYASPVLADGRIYYVARDGRTFVVGATPAFELLATNELRDRSTFNASPAIDGGRLYLRSEQYLYCVGANDVKSGVAYDAAWDRMSFLAYHETSSLMPSHPRFASSGLG